MGLEARLLLGHCSTRLSALSGPSRIGPTDHFEGIRASHIKGQTLVEMAGTHHRSHIMENVTLTPKEQSRLQVLNSLAAEQMTLDQSAELMGVTPRHARRILAAYRESGAAALAHGHRGRRPVNATPEALIADVAHLARTRYAGVNHTHLAELLAEREGIHIGRTTLRRVLLDAGLSSPRRRRPPKHRGPSATDAPGGHADPGGRQPSPVAGRPHPTVHVADRGGRCHRHGGERLVL